MILLVVPLILTTIFPPCSASKELGVIEPIVAWAEARQNSFVLILKEESKNLRTCTGYGSKYGNNIDNFAMPMNSDEIFGMLKDLIVINKANRHFFY